jgi:hypothetical protein
VPAIRGLALRKFLNIGSSREKTREVICAAIKSRRIIEFYYHGGFRTVEPFCLGLVLHGDANNESLLCYQIGGYSELREPIGWKLYRASEMSDIVVSKEQFSGDRPEYDPGSVEMEKLYCCVTPFKGSEAEPPKAIAAPAVEVPKIEKRELPSYEKPPARFLTHNELMRIFRFEHPDRLPELDTIHFYWCLLSDAAPNPLPERLESKFRPLFQLPSLFPYKDKRLVYGESENRGISVSPMWICVYPHYHDESEKQGISGSPKYIYAYPHYHH